MYHNEIGNKKHSETLHLKHSLMARTATYITNFNVVYAYWLG